MATPNRGPPISTVRREQAQFDPLVDGNGPFGSAANSNDPLSAPPSSASPIPLHQQYPPPPLPPQFVSSRPQSVAESLEIQADLFLKNCK